jgi:hypothetical protein
MKMSARNTRVFLLVSATLLSGGNAIAEDDDSPDAEFLEYLGSWEGTDEDWLLFSKDVDAESVEEETRSDPVPADDESREQDNES